VEEEMAFKLILVPIDGDAAATRAIDGAYLLAGRIGAHIEVFHVQADSKEAVPLLGEGMSGTMIEEMIELADKDAVERTLAARNAFDEFCTKNGVEVSTTPPAGDTVSMSWRQDVGREDEHVARRGRVADLIVMSRPGDTAERPSLMTLHAAIFETGKPVMMMPPGETTHLGETIAISWNGTAEASGAVASAIPLLRKANKVIALNVATEKSGARISIDDLLAQLAWHGVAAEQRTLSPVGKHVGEALLEECAKINCDLLVMGAYTHSRLLQIILGGVTRHIINNAKLPVFLSH